MTTAQFELERERIYDQARRLGLRFNRFRDRVRIADPYSRVIEGDLASMQSAVLEADLIFVLEQLAELFEGES